MSYHTRLLGEVPGRIRDPGEIFAGPLILLVCLLLCLLFGIMLTVSIISIIVIIHVYITYILSI